MSTWPGFGDGPVPYQERPFACEVCGQRYILLVSANACPHIKKNSPEVTAAINIMYPEEE